mgnify:CR=1 FL=1
MISKSFTLCLIFTVLLSISINAYRLDTLSHLNDIDEGNELNDPYLIQRLQVLLAAAAAASKHRSIPLNDEPISEHYLARRLTLNRRPGLIRLK